MTPRLTRRALTASALALPFAARAADPVKMTIATGVDPSFACFYVAKQAGIFARNGLDVAVNTGASGSAMVAFVIQNQIQAALGAEQAGILDFNLDPNVVVATETTVLEHWHAVVARNVADMDALRGKRIGIARGTGSETFWLAVTDKLKLNRADYKIVQVEAPEMVAALERGDIDAFACWEPWPTRATGAVQGAKILLDNVGIVETREFVFMNRGWAEKNQPAAVAFMRSLIEATDRINNQRPEAVKEVAGFLRLDTGLTAELMSKLRYAIRLDQGSIEALQMAERQLKSINKLAKPVDWPRFVYPDLLRAASPDRVGFTLPA